MVFVLNEEKQSLVQLVLLLLLMEPKLPLVVTLCSPVIAGVITE